MRATEEAEGTEKCTSRRRGGNGDGSGSRMDRGVCFQAAAGRTEEAEGAEKGTSRRREGTETARASGVNRRVCFQGAVVKGTAEAEGTEKCTSRRRGGNGDGSGFRDGSPGVLPSVAVRKGMTEEGGHGEVHLTEARRQRRRRVSKVRCVGRNCHPSRSAMLPNVRWSSWLCSCALRFPRERCLH